MTEGRPSLLLDAPHGWYGPPNSRRFHYFTNKDGRSLCGKWLTLAWDESLINVAYGPANGDCAECKRKLEAAKPPSFEDLAKDLPA